MTDTFLKTFSASTNIKNKNKIIYSSCLIFQAIMAFYESECTTGASVRPIPKKLIFQTFTIPTKLQETLKLSKSNSWGYSQSSNTSYTNSNTDRVKYRQVECTGILSQKADCVNEWENTFKQNGRYREYHPPSWWSPEHNCNCISRCRHQDLNMMTMRYGNENNKCT